MTPFTRLPTHAGYLVWTAISMCALGWVLTSFVPRVRRRTATVVAVIVLAGTTSVLASNVEFGQVDVALIVLHVGPHEGHSLSDQHNSLLLIPGVLLRESLIITSLWRSRC